MLKPKHDTMDVAHVNGEDEVGYSRRASFYISTSCRSLFICCSPTNASTENFCIMGINMLVNDHKSWFFQHKCVYKRGKIQLFPESCANSL